MSLNNKKPWEWLEDDYGEVKRKMNFEQIESSSEPKKNGTLAKICSFEMLTNF
jgi:ribosome biogenesis SPOUT family RNA methylase Rps3